MMRAIAVTLLMLSGAMLSGTSALAGERFVFPSIDGGEIDLAEFRGKPVLVVNTASMCAFTKQYDALQALHERYQDRAVVLAVPSDDFGGQEFGSEEEVQAFCEVNFGLTLPMTEITSVKGGDRHPFYDWAAKQDVTPNWNFHKILLDGDGQLVAEFGTTTGPNSPRVTGAIDALLGAS